MGFDSQLAKHQSQAADEAIVSLGASTILGDRIVKLDPLPTSLVTVTSPP